MASPETSGAARAARLATIPDRLNLGSEVVIGIYGSKDTRHILVRRPSGGIRQLGVGDRLKGARIVGIDENGVSVETGQGAAYLAVGEAPDPG